MYNQIILQCTKCKTEFSPKIRTPICPVCGGILNVIYSKEQFLVNEDIKSMWRYSLLPKFPILVTLNEGFTPLIFADKLSKEIGAKIMLKDETRNPTFSFIDRGASVEISRAKSLNVTKIVCAAQGDFGAAISAYSSRASIECEIYVPRDIDLGKVYQMILYGANVKIVNDYVDALAHANSRIIHDYVTSPASPWYLEGIKTIAFEISEKLHWKIPDFIIVPMGHGSLIYSLWKGFMELLNCDKIDTLPKFVGVQIKGMDPIVQVFRNKKPSNLRLKSIARDIEIKKPLLLELAVDVLKKTNGIAISVDENETINALCLIAKTEGLLPEPASAVTIAALKKLLEENIIERNDLVVALITGSAIKTPTVIENIISTSFKNIARVIVEKYKPTRLGDTKIMILKLLSQQPMYGYVIKQKLLKMFGINLTLPTIYQHLKELEELGLIASIKRKIGKRIRRYYMLTNKGLTFIGGLSA